jgi:hypothetical protein
MTGDKHHSRSTNDDTELDDAALAALLVKPGSAGRRWRQHRPSPNVGSGVSPIPARTPLQSGGSTP